MQVYVEVGSKCKYNTKTWDNLGDSLWSLEICFFPPSPTIFPYQLKLYLSIARPSYHVKKGSCVHALLASFQWVTHPICFHPHIPLSSLSPLSFRSTFLHEREFQGCDVGRRETYITLLGTSFWVQPKYLSFSLKMVMVSTERISITILSL